MTETLHEAQEDIILVSILIVTSLTDDMSQQLTYSRYRAFVAVFVVHS